MVALTQHRRRPRLSLGPLGRRRIAAPSTVLGLLVAVLALIVLGSMIRIGTDSPSSSIRATEPELSGSDTTALGGDAVGIVPAAEIAGDELAPTDPSSEFPDAIWPVTSRGRRFDGARDVVRSFANELVGFEDASVGQLHGFDGRTGTVHLQSRGGGPITVVGVERLEADGSWWVMGATTDGLLVAEPSPGSIVKDSLRVHGDAWSPDGMVMVELRVDDVPTPLATFEFATGGAEQPYWFEGRFGFAGPGRTSGVAMFSNRFPGSGEVASVTAVRIHFES